MKRNEYIILTVSILLPLTVTRIACAAPQPPEGVAYKTSVEYGKVGGESLKLDLAWPKESVGKRPCVVVIHGGAWRAGNRQQHTDIVFALAERGYVAATISYRFCPKHRFPAQVEDAKCAVRFLRANADAYNIDTDRFGAVGASAGAHLAMLLGVMDGKDGLEGDGGHADQSSKVQAVVSFFGPTDLAADDIPTLTIPLLFDFIGGTKIKFPEKYEQASPISYVDKGDAPMFLLQGTRDPLVPHSQAYKMIDVLTDAGVKGRTEILIGAGHGWRGKELERTLNQTYEFLDEHLQP